VGFCHMHRASRRDLQSAKCQEPSIYRWLEYGRSWRPCMRSSGIPSASIANGPMTSADFRHAWLQRWRCIIFVSGSMSNLAGHALLLGTWWPGNLMGFHIKRLSARRWEPVLGGARALPGDRSLCEGRCSSEFAAILQVKIRQWVSDMRRLMPILW